MPRIPDDLIARIKAEIPVEDLIRETGVDLKAQGKDLVARCPLHAGDATPSLVVTPEKGLWHCFGCDVGGDSIAWVMKTQRVGFRLAVELLSQRVNGAGLELRALGFGAKRSRVVLESPISEGDDETAALESVVRFYRQAGERSGRPLGYLAGRGLDSSELIERFEVGEADASLSTYIPNSDSKAGRAIRATLQRAGVFRQKSGKEQLDGCVTFPIRDEDGRVAQIYGRRMGRTKALIAGGSKHLVLAAPLRGVWNRQALAESKEIVLCEAILDAASFWVNGIRNVVATLGKGNFLEDHERAFARHGVRKVWIAFDRDDAGEKGAATVAAKLQALGIDCYRVQFPHGMDANDYALKVTPAARSLEVALNGAAWMEGGRAPSARSVVVVRQPPTPHPPTQDGAAAPAATRQLAASALRASAASEGPLKAEKAARGKELAGGPGDSGVDVPPKIAPVAPRPVELRDDEAVFLFDDRRYRVRGFAKATPQAMRVNIFASREGLVQSENSPLSGFHVETFDLYLERTRLPYERKAALELGIKEEIVHKDLGRVLQALEDLGSAATKKALEPKARVPTMSGEEKADGLELLLSPNLAERIPADIGKCGLVGETINKLVLYLACVSRLLDRPLAVIVQSNSAAGKSALMDAVLDFIPEEAKKKYVAMSAQALFYFSEKDGFRHKVLALAEEEGAEKASYALKMMQSEGRLTMAATGKDSKTGEFDTKEYTVEGPMALIQTTTSITLDEELLNRCLVLTVDESREQTRRIHAAQRERRSLEGLWAKKAKDAIAKVHQNAQRLLRPLAVLNPYADRLTFLDEKTRLRRDHEKYLTLIDAIALLHQYQRRVKSDTRNGQTVEYVEVEPADIALANRLASEVLGRTLDELPPQTRRFLELFHELVSAESQKNEIDPSDFWVSCRQLREFTGWSNTRVWVHVERLIELEYVLVHRAPRGIGHVYELLYDGQGKQGERFLLGLIDVAKLDEDRKHRRPVPTFPPSDPTIPPPEAIIPGRFRPDSGVIPGVFGSRNANASTAKDPISGVQGKKSSHVAVVVQATVAGGDDRRQEAVELAEPALAK